MSKKSKIIIICLAVAIVAILAVVIPLTVIKFDKNTQLKTPSQPEIIGASSDLIVIKTSEIEGAKLYKFTITTPKIENNKAVTITFENEKNILTLDLTVYNQANFEMAGIYSVQCEAIAENEKNNSYKSVPTNFEREIKLKATEVIKSNTFLKWESINYADYYEIYINSDSVSKKLKVNCNSVEGMESIQISSLKSQLDLPSNQYSISIRAFSQNTYFKTSNYSNTLLINID